MTPVANQAVLSRELGPCSLSIGVHIDTLEERGPPKPRRPYPNREKRKKMQWSRKITKLAMKKKKKHARTLQRLVTGLSVQFTHFFVHPHTPWFCRALVGRHVPIRAACRSLQEQNGREKTKEDEGRRNIKNAGRHGRIPFCSWGVYLGCPVYWYCWPLMMAGSMVRVA